MYDKAVDIHQVIKELKVPTQTEPNVKDNSSKTEEKIRDIKYKQYLQQETLPRQNTENLLSLILAQYTPGTNSKLNIQDNWKTMKSGYAVVELMNALYDVTYMLEGQNNTYVSLHSEQRDTSLIKQGE